MPNRQLIIIGAGGHGKVIAEIARLNGYKAICFLDDEVVSISGYLGKIAEYIRYVGSCDFFVAIGNNAIRQKIQDKICSGNARIINLIHPQAVISPNVIFGAGVAVMAGVVINTGAKIGNGVIINTCSSVDHDFIVHNYAHISVGAHIAGTVEIGERTFVGAGVTVINNVTICSDCIVGAGGVVIKNLAQSGVYKGVPVKI